MKRDSYHRYLLYAIGEILIVFLGILIALQVDNWNEDRLNVKDLNNILEEVLKDLNNDLPIVKEHLKGTEDKIAVIDSVIYNKIDKERLYQCYMCLNEHAWYNEINLPNRGYRLLNTFLSSNELLNDSLVNEILEFYLTFINGESRLATEISDNVWENRKYQMEHMDFTLDEWIQTVNTWTANKEIADKMLNDQENLKRMVWHKALLKVYIFRLEYYITNGEILKERLESRFDLE